MNLNKKYISIRLVIAIILIGLINLYSGIVSEANEILSGERWHYGNQNNKGAKKAPKLYFALYGISYY